MTIALYYSPGSCSLAPHIVLNEVGQPFELRRFATADRANYSPEYLAVNPKGRIPALQIDGCYFAGGRSHFIRGSQGHLASNKMQRV